ncbi:MAG: DNA-formamidopyrimidine glycosylase family protein, partial [Mycoplasmatales bacterium]
MPELPEVETVKKILSGLVIGKKIRDIDVRCEKM